MKRLIGIGTVISAMMLLSACVAAPAGLTAENTPPEPSVLLQTATEVPTLTPAAAQPPSETPIPPTATPKPTTVPPVNFVRPGLRTGIVDVNYVEDACQFYSQRWVEGNAAPWTVVLPVMFHGVRKEGGEVSDNMTVTHDYFVQSMEHAKKLGFDTITSKQLVDFLERNAPIPERSLLLIIDDRRLGTFEQHFLPYMNEYNWTTTLAYITGVANDREWTRIKDVLDTGHADLQAHGYLHNGQTYVTTFTPEDVILGEIKNPITAFEGHNIPRPIAFIWPGGNYNEYSVKMAQENGYKVGFTVHSRGALMFNSIPQGEQERKIGNPFFTLPRSWSTAMYVDLDAAAALSESAKEYAQTHRDEEIAWVQANCAAASETPIPTP